MGKIYFNKQTGSIYENHHSVPDPPSGYEDTGISVNHTFVKGNYYARSYYCRNCKEYHLVFQVMYTSKSTLFTVNYGSEFGCETVKKMASLATFLGNRDKHYDFVLQVAREGTLEAFNTILKNTRNEKLRKQIVDAVLSKRDVSKLVSEAIIEKI